LLRAPPADSRAPLAVVAVSEREPLRDAPAVRSTVGKRPARCCATSARACA
jgi:hypothetical protein